MKLNGLQIQQLQKALLSAFPTKDLLAIMVRIELEVNLDEIAGGENLRVVVFKLVTWAESCGRVAELIQGAYHQNNGNPDVQQLMQDARTWEISAQTAHPTAQEQIITANTVVTSIIIDVFLSYSRVDIDIIHPLYTHLQEAGFTVWIGEELDPGTPNWQMAIEEMIRQAHCLVVVLTPNAKLSPWVNQEISYAHLLGRPIVPVLVSGTESTAIPINLVDEQWIDVRQDYHQVMHQTLFPSLRRYLQTNEPIAPATVQSFPKFPVDFTWMLIAAGEFLIGSDRQKGKQVFDNETPQHRLYLPKFYITRIPVTVAQFTIFIETTGYKTTAEQRNTAWGWTGFKYQEIKGATWRQPRGSGSSVEQNLDHPVTCISWYDALTFCRWAGVRLPNEAEWEKAARGTDGRLYPWGNRKPIQNLCNFNMNIGNTTSVNTYLKGISPYGVMDLAGNVWEWTSNLYSVYPYNPDDGREDPESTGIRTLRGGSFHNVSNSVRCAVRIGHNPYDRADNIGFRIVFSTL